MSVHPVVSAVCHLLERRTITTLKSAFHAFTKIFLQAKETTFLGNFRPEKRLKQCSENSEISSPILEADPKFGPFIMLKPSFL